METSTLPGAAPSPEQGLTALSEQPPQVPGATTAVGSEETPSVVRQASEIVNNAFAQEGPPQGPEANAAPEAGDEDVPNVLKEAGQILTEMQAAYEAAAPTIKNPAAKDLFIGMMLLTAQGSLNAVFSGENSQSEQVVNQPLGTPEATQEMQLTQGKAESSIARRLKRVGRLIGPLLVGASTLAFPRSEVQTQTVAPPMFEPQRPMEYPTRAPMPSSQALEDAGFQLGPNGQENPSPLAQGAPAPEPGTQTQEQPQPQEPKQTGTGTPIPEGQGGPGTLMDLMPPVQVPRPVDIGSIILPESGGGRPPGMSKEDARAYQEANNVQLGQAPIEAPAETPAPAAPAAPTSPGQ